MKMIASILLSASICSAAWAAETSVTVKKVHLCCDECVHGVERSLEGVKGVTMTADKKAGTVTLTSSDTAALQKAVNSMAEGGYFGMSDNRAIQPTAKTGAKDAKVKSMHVAGVHLCCGGCVKAVDRAIKNTPGVTGHTAKKNAATFTVTGDFNDQKFFEALRQEGLSGHVTDKAAPEPADSKHRDDH